MLRTIIIDDDPIVTFLQSKMVSKAGLDEDPTVFKDPHAGLDFLQENLSPEDNIHYLIMLDINMPSMDGWEFLEKLKEVPNNEFCHVVMVTSSIDRRDKRNAANDEHVVDFIEKPVSAKHCSKLKGISPLSRFFKEN
ncbi:two-component system response regulator [Gramella sp. KN1008]|uniref:response regulator n=1 Tax=Gramella sp. KN1008 TaxID=2529298 RepID=UPI00103C7E62|nr:response regulator [Gramella sp. KN1008]TBW26433.1 response regulator [Gramella sp. KN1008]